MAKQIIKLTGVAVLVFCLISGQPGYAAADKVIERTFEVNPGGTLLLKTDAGSVQVHATDQKKVMIRVKMDFKGQIQKEKDEFLEQMDIDFSQSGDNVEGRVKLPKRWLSWGENVRLEFEIEVPRRYNLDMNTAGGSIWVDNMEGEVLAGTSGGSIRLGEITGPVDVNTSGGSIQLEGSGGDVFLETSGGNITIGRVTGNVSASTSGGSVSIEQATGSVDAKTSGGSISVAEVKGSISARTSGGSVTAYISEQPSADCTLKTSGGGITVQLDPAVAVYLDAETNGGNVNTDFEVLVQGKQDENNLRGKINGGGPQLYLRTSGSNIHVRKK